MKVGLFNRIGSPIHKVDIYKFPMNKSVIKSAKAIIVHNEYMKNEIEKINFGAWSIQF